MPEDTMDKISRLMFISDDVIRHFRHSFEVLTLLSELANRSDNKEFKNICYELLSSTSKMVDILEGRIKDETDTMDTIQTITNA